ncbi:MAG: RsmD family RNA methyltransferase [Bacteroidia bacterium]|nr:RsmD family RNA methyltransferase [Bacteroidia bacterium]
MRIIGGTHKGRAFHPPKNLPVRPTTDFGKEALFNILTTRINFEQTKALDLFAGTGSISYELASRGCSEITAVDADYGCCSFVKKKATELAFKGIKVIKQNVFRFLKNTTEHFDLIFADPPFGMKETVEIPTIVFANKLLNPNGILIIEHPAEISFEKTGRFVEQRKYSKLHFSIFS